MPSGEHPNSRANLQKPWKKGECGNPKGRPKGSGITDKLKKILDEPAKEGSDMTTAEVLARAAIKAAAKGDHRFFKEILDRVEGKVKDKVEVDGDIRVIEQRFVVAKPPEGGDDADR